MLRRTLPLLLPLAAVAVFALLGTARGVEDEEEVELAPFMGNLQTYAQKLGYSLDAKNARLALFYETEIEEVVGEMREKVPVHDGLPLDYAAKTILVPALGELRGALEAGDLARAGERYTGMIDACNRCHAAMEHEFIRILEPEGPPPYAQDFAPKGE